LARVGLLEWQVRASQPRAKALPALLMTLNTQIAALDAARGKRSAPTLILAARSVRRKLRHALTANVLAKVERFALAQLSDRDMAHREVVASWRVDIATVAALLEVAASAKRSVEARQDHIARAANLLCAPRTSLANWIGARVALGPRGGNGDELARLVAALGMEPTEAARILANPFREYDREPEEAKIAGSIRVARSKAKRPASKRRKAKATVGGNSRAR